MSKQRNVYDGGNEHLYRGPVYSRAGAFVFLRFLPVLNRQRLFLSHVILIRACLADSVGHTGKPVFESFCTFPAAQQSATSCFCIDTYFQLTMLTDIVRLQPDDAIRAHCYYAFNDRSRHLSAHYRSSTMATINHASVCTFRMRFEEVRIVLKGDPTHRTCLVSCDFEKTE